ncbi:hypothetical protein J3458_016880 [Metarhizium acridum]|uniref:uncharacterized protein n=1 Tax=Metarhizium acridum TaxID=92637 RepID=UPI001C6C21C4|nr:hypothetical protein J3458_016880 [Metarhizium acridum]
MAAFTTFGTWVLERPCRTDSSRSSCRISPLYLRLMYFLNGETGVEPKTNRESMPIPKHQVLGREPSTIAKINRLFIVRRCIPVMARQTDHKFSRANEQQEV